MVVNGSYSWKIRGRSFLQVSISRWCVTQYPPINLHHNLCHLNYRPYLSATYDKESEDSYFLASFFLKLSKNYRNTKKRTKIVQNLPPPSHHTDDLASNKTIHAAALVEALLLYILRTSNISMVVDSVLSLRSNISHVSLLVFLENERQVDK